MGEPTRHPVFPPKHPKLLYFAIYYEVDDHAFQRAAETWVPYRTDAFLAHGFDPTKDVLVQVGIRTEDDFRAAWSNLAKRCRDDDAWVIEGHLFTHASWVTTGTTGLEFARSPANTNDGTLTQDEILGLEQLRWHPTFGSLVLEGCNTGETSVRGWCPAQAFAQRQHVKASGQAGWGYFSSDRLTFVELRKSGDTILDDHVFLWAYNCNRNSPLGDGARLPAPVFNP